MSVEFSHVSDNNQPGMVDVGSKLVTLREAEAQSIVWLGRENIDLFVKAGWENKKGGILQTAIIGGTMAAKNGRFDTNVSSIRFGILQNNN